MDSLQAPAACDQALAALSSFRTEFYACLTRRADALFELTDALLCADGPVSSLPELSLEPVHRRGHGALYDALACGRIHLARLQLTLTGLDLPHLADGQLAIAIDITPWPRPDAECSPDRVHCHRPCRCDGKRKTIPGWPYSIAAALGPGRTCWTAPLEVRGIGAAEDVTEATAGQIRDLIERLVEAGQWAPGDPPVLIVCDAGYDIVRLSWLLGDLPVRLLGRIRADRVMYTPAPPARRDGKPGRRPRHGSEFTFADPSTWPAADTETISAHDRFGKVSACLGMRLHPKLERRLAWADHTGVLPIVEGAVIYVSVERLPGGRRPQPLWLWFSDPQAAGVDLDGLWRAYLRRFDLEYTFRMWKQVLGLTRPRVRSPAQADRWFWLIVVAYTQLGLARHLVEDLRRLWEGSLSVDRLTPGRVRRGFRRIHRALGTPAGAPKPGRPGPGRPRGRVSRPAPRYPVGKKYRKADMPRRGGKKQPG